MEGVFWASTTIEDRVKDFLEASGKRKAMEILSLEEARCAVWGMARGDLRQK